MIREDHWDCNVKTLSTDGFVSDPAGWFSEHSMHSMQGRDALFLAHADGFRPVVCTMCPKKKPIPLMRSRFSGVPGLKAGNKASPC